MQIFDCLHKELRIFEVLMLLLSSILKIYLFDFNQKRWLTNSPIAASIVYYVERVVR